MAARSVCVLIIFAVVISVTGMLATWIMRFQQSEIRRRSSINSFTVNSEAEMATLASASDVTEGGSNKPKAQILTNIPGGASVNTMSGSSVVSRASSVAIAELSLQTTAETAAASAAGAVRSTAGETTVSSGTREKVKIHTLPGTKKAERRETEETTATTCTQIQESANVETLINTAQKTPEPDRISESDIIQTHKSETDVTIFEKPAEISITPKQESGTSRFDLTITATANIRSVTPIMEPMTVTATNLIASKLKTSQITPETKTTTKTTPDITFRTEAVMTETKADLIEGKLALTTIIISPKTAGTGSSKVETSEKNTVRPTRSPQGIKTLNGPTVNEATGINLVTMIQTATGKQAKTPGKQAGSGTTIKSNVLMTTKSITNYLNNISPKRQTDKVFEKLTTRSNNQTKSTTKNTTGRRDQDKNPMSHKTFYSAVTLGSILIICSLLVLIVFLKDFIGPN